MSSCIRLDVQQDPGLRGCSYYLLLFNKAPNLSDINNLFSMLLASVGQKSREGTATLLRGVWASAGKTG